MKLGARRPDIGARGLYIESIAAQVPARAKGRPEMEPLRALVGSWPCLMS